MGLMFQNFNEAFNTVIGCQMHFEMISNFVQIFFAVQLHQAAGRVQSFFIAAQKILIEILNINNFTTNSYRVALKNEYF